MTILQKYSVNEYIFGSQYIRIAISNSYNGLFIDETDENNADDIIITNIINAGVLKQDLNTDNGDYAVDEYTFEIDELSCNCETDIHALAFVLDSTDALINRYLAVWYGVGGTDVDITDIKQLRFSGKLQTKISGEDLIWDGHLADYSNTTNAKRNYKFSAISLDVAQLEKCKTKDSILIENNEGGYTDIDNIKTRLEANNFEVMRNIFTAKPSWALKHNKDGWQQVNITGLATLYDIVQMYLNLSSIIIYETTGATINYLLEESNLPFQLCPNYYGCIDETAHYGYGLDIEVTESALSGIINNVEQYINPTKLTNIRISPTPFGLEEDGTTPWSNLYFSRNLIYPTCGVAGCGIGSLYKDTMLSAELGLSFLQYDSIDELLFAVAKSIGCYLKFTNSAAGYTKVKFVPRSNLSAANSKEITIINAEKGSIDTSSNQNTDYKNFYASINGLIAEGFYDNYYGGSGRGGATPYNSNPTEQYNRMYKTVTTESEKLLFALGSPCHTYAMRKVEKSFVSAIVPYPFQVMPINNYHYVLNGTDTGWSREYLEWFPSAKYDLEYRYQFYSIEQLTAGMYIQTTLDSIHEQHIINHLGATTPIWRPACLLVTNINGVNKYYTKLADYINDINIYDKQYYNTEYTLEVPFFNGFAESSDLTNKSWQNLELGNIIKLQEIGYSYNQNNNTFEQNTFIRNYTIISIETSSATPKTILKLQNTERFAFGQYEGELPTEYNRELLSADGGDGNIVHSVDNIFEYEIGTLAESVVVIHAGDICMIDSFGKLFYAQPLSSLNCRVVGIALDNGITGDTIAVITHGLYTNDDLNLESGKYVFCIANDTNNMSQTCNLTTNENYDMLVYMGIAQSSKSILINIVSYKIEG